MASAPSENRDLVLVGPVKRGRPSSFNADTAQEILERLWEGDSLLTICADDDMPPLRTVYKWMDANADFRQNYTRARERQADTFAEKIQDVAFNLAILPEHKRIMVDSIKWRAARQNWRAWGDKVTHEVELSPHAPGGAEQLPAGLAWLAGHLENKSDKEG